MSDAAAHPMTVEEFLVAYEGREGKWELEDGRAYAMSGERLEHGRVKAAAWLALRDAIRRAGLPCEAVTDSVLIRITPRTAYRPDALVYCGERMAPTAREVPNPVLVFEVLSPSSENRDVHRKLIAYFTVASVAHYLILHPSDRSLVAYRRGRDGVIEARPLMGGELRLDPPGLEVRVEDLFGEA